MPQITLHGRSSLLFLILSMGTLSFHNFRGAPLQTAIAKHVLERICKKSFMDQVRGSSEVLKKELNRLVTEYPNILTGPVRGRGLIMGLEVKNLQSEDQAKQSEPTISQIINLSRQNGLLLLSCGQSIIRFVPSLIISHSEVSQMIQILEKVLAHLSSSKV
jgi:acetylornithine aminotransferase